MMNLRGQLASTTLWAVAFLAALPSVTPGQVDRMNYRHWTWLQQQRRVLLADLLKQEKPRLEAAAVALLDNAEQLPLLTIARAIAKVRGVTPDAGFFYRSGLQVYALPEVLAKGHELAVTVHAPYSGLTGKLAQPKKFRFELRVINAKGDVVHADKIEETDQFRDLREFRSVSRMKIADLPEGQYVVHVDTILDGDAPRSTDLPLRVPIGIVHDYGDRAGAFRLVPENQKLLAALHKLTPLPRAVLHGASEYASRAWSGTPGVNPAHAVQELVRAERILKNVAMGVFPLNGLSGRVSIALPVESAQPSEKEVVFLTLRLPAGGLPARGSPAWKSLAKRPLVLAMSGVPVLDHQDRRPSFPHYALPSFLSESLHVAGFDAKAEFQLVVTESPGRTPNTRRALEAVLRHLPELYPFDQDRLVLVGEGHGASGMADLALQIPKRVRGLVLVNSTGGLATPQLRELRDHPILIVPGHGRLGADELSRMRLYAKDAKKVGIEILDDRKWPWSIALPLAAREIEAFARRVVAR